MCGIFGVILSDRGQRPDSARLHESGTLLSHRGPDDLSTYAGEGVGFAHTRLSLLDLDERGNQPMWDRSRRYAIVFNGEIYNFRELRAGLEARGEHFGTATDTEVLLRALMLDDPARVLPSLRGMFAFCFADRERGTFLLARDRFGMKPLYLARRDADFLFASEAKALKPWMAVEVDRFSAASFLMGHGGPTRGPTFFDGVTSVDPGTMITIDAENRVKSERFFGLEDFLDRDMSETLRSMSRTQIVDELDDRLDEAVSTHLFADATVGAFCSGGVDSSLLMAAAAKKRGQLAIFHANVKGRWSEQHAAQALASHLDLELESVDVTDQDFVDLLPSVTRHYEQPITYHPNCAPLMIVAQLARNSGVKGLLSGEGSDECYLGYPWLGRKRLTDSYDRLRTGLRKLTHSIPELGKIVWPPTTDRRSAQVRSLLNRREVCEDEDRVRDRAGELGDLGSDPRTLWTLDYLHYHLRTLLHRNDTMGMSASIEARFPFLDNPVVRFAVNLPSKYKLRPTPSALVKAHPFVQDKWVVRAVARRYMPRALSHRTKLGFWTTVFSRTRTAPAFFESAFVQTLLGLKTSSMRTAIERADADLATRLLHLEVWGRVFLQGESDHEIRESLGRHVTIDPE